ncbi:unnamed protein product [Arctia plantaginis]|uniref:GDT1 family protein n=1 Tax=Arctia plantaginis TaxID=874455 RepID=A0A8S1AT94_ARCPL|nr:unnamed protein product [Arctia plantaginis]
MSVVVTQCQVNARNKTVSLSDFDFVVNLGVYKMVIMLKKRSVCLAAMTFAATWAFTLAQQAHVPVSPSPVAPVTTPQHTTAQGSFWKGFLASLSVVIVSELGDKTFFIAAIMAMKHPRIIVFAGAISALVLMTILSAAFGSIATVIPRIYTHYISAALFAIFGIKMLRDGFKMDPNEGQEELEEVQSELKRREDQEEKEETLDMLELGQAENRRRKRNAVIRVLLQAASLTFLAEWGDRSQLATVVLATREHPIGVIIGGSLGHALCTGLAVIGGRMVASKISVRTVTIIGGLVFLFFAVSALVIGPGE